MRLTTELEDTAVARWYRTARFRPDHAGRDAGGTSQRLNWQTRTRYYETLATFLDASGGSTAGLARDALAAAAGQRRPSTLYYLVSPKSSGSLAGALRAATPWPLYERRRGERVVDLLMTETKVWSYWPHREGWLEALDDLTVTDRWLAAAGLVRVLADWAVCARPLARAAGFAPPLAAVEDLLTLSGTGTGTGTGHVGPAGVDGLEIPWPGGALPGGQGLTDTALGGESARDARFAEVTDLLTTVVRTALGSDGIAPGLVLGAVHGGLAALVTQPPSQSDEITTDLVDLLTQLEHLLPRLPDDRRRRMADELAPRLRAVLGKLADRDGQTGGGPQSDGGPR